MRLEWKYTLIINGFILVTMSIFFMINDRMVKKESVLSVIRDYFRGAAMRDIANEIQAHITGEYDVDRLEKAIRSLDLSKDLEEKGLEIVDINVMDPNGLVIASLTEESLYDQMDSNGLQRVMSRQMRLRYPPEGYHGHWVIEYTLPYILSDPSEREELGALQIMFSAKGIASYSRRLRMRNLLYIVIVTLALTIFIIPLTSYLIVRRLERLMETVAAAQAGNPVARARDSSQDEIGRLSRSFNRMIDQIRSEHARRLEAVGTLAAGVAHEVRNPLNSIAMTIQYLKDTFSMLDENDQHRVSSIEHQETAQECLDVITRQVEELDRIVEDFLQLTRPVEMNWKTVDLNVFLSDVLRNFASSLEIADVKLVCNYSRDMLYPRIDRDKLRRAISNIIINSIQAMPDGGELRISTARDVSQNAAIIDISDTGVGIPQENIDRLFEPYFTTKPDGTGLGLAISYRMIEAHGGEIRVKSEEGQGAIFTVVLPQS
jgi:signal transduction histidine kinase